MYKINEIEDIAKNTQRLFFIYLSIFSYCIITILAIKDRQLILTELNVILPLLNVGVPLNFFFIFGPILCTLSFLYFIINYIQFRNEVESWIGEEKLNKDKKNELIKISSKYILLTPISKIKQIYREQKRNIIIKKIILWVFIWWLLPVVLFLFTLKYIKTHETIGTILLSSLTIISIWIGSYFYLGLHWFQKKKKKEKNLFQNILFFIIILFSIILGIRIYFFYYNAKQGITKYFFHFERLGYCNTVDLSYQSCINNKSEDVKYWGKFRNLKLEGANLEGAYLKRIDFKNGNFKRVNFSKANLDYADLSGSNCEYADFSDTNMEGTIFKDVSADYAEFKNSYLKNINFENSSLNSCFINKSKLININFNNASLISSNIENSHLLEINFENTHLEGTDFSSNQIILTDFLNTYLTCTNLYNTYISCSNFSISDLKLVDFNNAKLYKTKIFITNEMSNINFNKIYYEKKTIYDSDDYSLLKNILSIIKNNDNTEDLSNDKILVNKYKEKINKDVSTIILSKNHKPNGIFYNKDHNIYELIKLENNENNKLQIKNFTELYVTSWHDYRIEELLKLYLKGNKIIKKQFFEYGINPVFYKNSDTYIESRVTDKSNKIIFKSIDKDRL